MTAPLASGAHPESGAFFVFSEIFARFAFRLRLE